MVIGAPVPQEIDLDVASIAISSGLCLLVSVLFGLLPAVRFSRPNLIPALKEDAGGGGRQTIRVHRVAAMVQIGIAIPFLVISGVMLDRVRTADFGFPTDGLAAARLPAPVGSEQEGGFSSGGFATISNRPAAFARWPWPRACRLTSTSGSFASRARMTRSSSQHRSRASARISSRPSARRSLRGRTITAEDRIMAAPVAVISEPLAAQLFPATEPIGERVTVTLEEGREQEFTIVGVSADFATSQLTTERPQILLPLPDLSTGVSAKGRHSRRRCISSRAARRATNRS